MPLDRHGNKCRTRTTPRARIDVRKLPAEAVPYGTSISLNGRHVWGAFDDDVLVCVAATADEARRKYRFYKRAEGDGRNIGEG